MKKLIAASVVIGSVLSLGTGCANEAEEDLAIDEGAVVTEFVTVRGTTYDRSAPLGNVTICVHKVLPFDKIEQCVSSLADGSYKIRVPTGTTRELVFTKPGHSGYNILVRPDGEDFSLYANLMPDADTDSFARGHGVRQYDRARGGFGAKFMSFRDGFPGDNNDFQTGTEGLKGASATITHLDGSPRGPDASKLYYLDDAFRIDPNRVQTSSAGYATALNDTPGLYLIETKTPKGATCNSRWLPTAGGKVLSKVRANSTTEFWVRCTQ